jgi:predicted alpha-1,2-mannosidase
MKLLSTVGRAGALLMAICAGAQAAPRALTQYVDPMIGTLASSAPHTVDGGNVVPAAGLPSGMVQWGPDTRLGKKRPRAPMGYYYDANTITGFSLTHISGAGCSAQGEFPLMPTSDARRMTASFSHANETAAAGYYSVRFDSGIRTELTATLRSGLGRFSYPSGQPALLVLEADRTHSTANPTVATLALDADGGLSGTTQGGDFCRSSWRTPVHFYARFDRKPLHAKIEGGRAVLDFGNAGQVQAKVAISYVSVANARDNLDRENPDWDFDAMRARADQAWNERLNAIVVDGGAKQDLVKLYTALYHALWAPSVFSDGNGQYRGMDRQVHQLAPGQQAQYSTFSGWDIYRSLIPLHAWLAPRAASDMAQSLVNDADQCGALPRWVLNNIETGVMAGPSGVLMVAQAYAFGAGKFDTAGALRHMARMADLPGTACNGHLSEAGRGSYLKYGYIAQDEWSPLFAKPNHEYIYCRDKNMEHNRCNAEGEIGHASTTLEYASADFAAASFAAALGERRSARIWLGQSANWKNLLRPGPKPDIVARNPDGSWNDSGELGESRSYLEGNAEQYLWMIPHDAANLVQAVGGPAAATARLDRFFSILNAGQELPNFYMGNEPGFGLPWLYNWTGAPHRTQQVVQQIMRETFGSGPDGLAGNDDTGAVSAWYVWAALGLYPAVPGQAGFAVSSPQFERIQLRTGAGATLEIRAPGAPAKNYIHGLTVNGRPHARPWIDLADLAGAAKLEFAMGAQPSSWGAAALPPSFGAAAARLADGADNQGIGADGSANAEGRGADFDGARNSYSAQALAAAGADRMLVDGVRLAWHAGPAGLDNMVAHGQDLLLDQAASGRHLLVLGAASNGPSTGRATVNYADGGRQAFELALDDWTLNAGRDAPRTSPVLKTSYRNRADGSREEVATYVFCARVPIDPARKVLSVTLPAQVSAGRQHIFALQVAP